MPSPGQGQMKPGAARDGVAEASRSPRPLLQYETPAFDDRLREPYGVREAGWISLGGCQPDRVEAKVRMDALIKCSQRYPTAMNGHQSAPLNQCT